MDLLILLTYDLIFMINDIVLPYLVMTEPFSGYTTMHGRSILVFCLFACQKKTSFLAPIRSQNGGNRLELVW